MDHCIGCHTCVFPVAYAVLWLEVLLCIEVFISGAQLQGEVKELQNFLLWDLSSLIFWGNIYQSALISRNLPCLEQFLVVHIHICDTSNLIFVHWNCIDSICGNLGGLVVWYPKRWPGFDSQPGSILSTVNYLQLMIYF